MGVCSGEGGYKVKVLDKGIDPEAFDLFIVTHHVCGFDGKYFQGEYQWHVAYPEYNYCSDKDYSIEQLTKDFPGLVLFGYETNYVDFFGYPDYKNIIIVNGKRHIVSEEYVDGYLLGPIINDDLIIDFGKTYLQEEKDG